MMPKKFNKSQTEQKKEINKKKNLKEVLSDQDFENIAKRLKKYTDNYLRYLSVKEIK